MGQRLVLQTLLEEALGSENVYFQPPANVQMQYPAIVYNRDFATTKFADNGTYRYVCRYQVSVITRNPDSDIILLKIAALPTCTYVRYFSTDGLNHDIFTLYF